MKQGAGCRNCKSLIGAALFERRGGEWQLVADHRFLSVDGVWGAPPAVSVAFRPGGGVELQITRVHGDQVKQIASVVLIDKDRVVKSAITPASAAEPRPKPRAAARSPSPAVDSPFPSSADGPRAQTRT
ncbi:MAG TPA: hypothetical protein VFB75_17040 [Burkholderiales bacterium]|nr:hypothetical protein [Burkholderiales bacterium]